MDQPRGEARMALIDFGLVASIRQDDMDSMVSAIIHLANRDYPSLVDDFIRQASELLILGAPLRPSYVSLLSSPPRLFPSVWASYRPTATAPLW